MGSRPAKTKAHVPDPAPDRTRVLRVAIAPTTTLVKGKSVRRTIVPPAARVLIETYMRREKTGYQTYGERSIERRLYWRDGAAHVVEGSDLHRAVIDALDAAQTTYSAVAIEGHWRIYRDSVLFKMPESWKPGDPVMLVATAVMGKKTPGGPSSQWKPWRGAVTTWPYRKEIIGHLASCEEPVKADAETFAVTTAQVITRPPTLADADACARGASLVVQQQGGPWELCINRYDGESAKAWEARVASYRDKLGTGDRARLYDGRGRCAWDSQGEVGTAADEKGRAA